MSTTSPSQQGVEGTDAQEVWIITEESVILVISTSLFGKICILPQRRHILCLLATFQRLVAQFVGIASLSSRTLRVFGASRRCPVQYGRCALDRDDSAVVGPVVALAVLPAGLAESVRSLPRRAHRDRQAGGAVCRLCGQAHQGTAAAVGTG